MLHGSGRRLAVHGRVHRTLRYMSASTRELDKHGGVAAMVGRCTGSDLSSGLVCDHTHAMTVMHVQQIHIQVSLGTEVPFRTLHNEVQ